MGANDGAEICELVGDSLLYELSILYEKKDIGLYRDNELAVFNPLSANPTKWSNTLKQFVGNLPANCLTVFDHLVILALKGLKTLNFKSRAFKKLFKSHFCFFTAKLLLLVKLIITIVYATLHLVYIHIM